MFYMGTSNGRAYGVKSTKTGQVFGTRVWGTVLSATVCHQQSSAAASSYGNLFSLDAADGLPTWSAPAQNMDSIFAMVGDFYVGRNISGAMAILSAETGIQQPMSHTVEVHTPVLNEETDRLYLVDRTVPFSVFDLPTAKCRFSTGCTDALADINGGSQETRRSAARSG